VSNLDSENSMLLLWHKLAFNGVIRVIKVEVSKVYISKSFNKVHPTVVAKNLRLTNRVQLEEGRSQEKKEEKIIIIIFFKKKN
jgi:hypothetical protein